VIRGWTLCCQEFYLVALDMLTRKKAQALNTPVVPDVPGWLTAVFVLITAIIAFVSQYFSVDNKIKELVAGVTVKAPRGEIPRRRTWIGWLHELLNSCA
jgi:hypothetical protein